MSLWVVMTMLAAGAGMQPVAFGQARPGQDAVLAQLQRQDQAVATAGFRLALSNVGLCRDRAFLTGIVPHYLSQYGAAYRDAASARFELDSSPSILAVAAGSPAAIAGLRANDRLLAIDGEAFAPGERDRAGAFEDTERALGILERASADGAAMVYIERATQRFGIPVRLVKGCRSRFQVVPDAVMSAKADGSYVQVSASLVDFTRGEGELASVLAHELAHNLLAHRVRLERQGAAGRKPRSIRATEIEADRLSPYLMANASYDPRDAIRYWARHGAKRGDRWFRRGTHPGWRERLRSIETEVGRIEAARARGDTLAIPADLAAALATG